MATMSQVFEIVKEFEKGWRRLRGYRLIGQVIEGVKFVKLRFVSGPILGSRELVEK